MKRDIRYTFLFFILLIITGVIFGIEEDGDKIFRIMLTAAVIIVSLVCYLWIKFNAVIYGSILVFVFISMYLGNIVSFYSIPFYDKFLHLISGIFLYIIGENILRKYIKDETKFFRYIFSILFSVAFAGLWEIWEYSGDCLFGFSSQGGLDDTMQDIIAGSIGAFFTFFCYYIKNIVLKDRKN